MMAPVSRQVKVTLAGQKFSVRTDARPKYVRELAAFVNQKMEEAKQSGKVVTTQALALLAAMSIADDLFQQREREEELRRDIRNKSKRILRYLDKEAQS
jgi:cell division protein ZapA (FtsZ GTPase activity inhibitor)